MGYQKLVIVLAMSFSWISLAHFDNHQQTSRGETNRIVKHSPLSHRDIHASARMLPGPTNVFNNPATNVFNNPNQHCYKQFFVGNKPPEGLRHQSLTSNIKYICQQIPTTLVTYYATMFDEKHGIPVYSAYYVNKPRMDVVIANKIHRKDIDQTWRTEKGIEKQGTDAMYAGKSTYDKGHLLPVNIYSFSAEHVTSTFTYTNAVPQVAKFNRGEWKTYEEKILDYAIDMCTHAHPNAVLYLITGTTIKIRFGDDAITTDKTLKEQGKNNFIKVPGSMWTAGCCLAGASVTSNFAVIGGNLGSLKMAELSVGDLQNFLEKDPGVTAGAVNLFPGNKDCSDSEKNQSLLK